MSRLPLTAALLVTFGLVLGCSGEPSAQDPGRQTSEPSTETQQAPPSSAAEPAAGNPAEPCALLPGESVGEQFDIDAVTAKPLAEQQAANGAKVYLCQYTADAAGTELGALTVSVHEGNQIEPAAMIDAVKGNYTAPKDVAGVGDAAATFEDADSRYLAAATAVSGTPVMVMYIGSKNATEQQLSALVGPAIDQL